MSGGKLEGCDYCGLLVWKNGGWVKEEDCYKTSKEEEIDDDTEIEPTVKDIDVIYKFILDIFEETASVYASSVLLPPKIEKMLITLDRVSNSINRKE
tara:strand:- start:7 stop:297 length:291 start_codon:yes stop_codon:yes gene_type:complete